MYEQDAKNRAREKQKKEGVADYAEVASIHGINYIFEGNVVVFSRYDKYVEQDSVNVKLNSFENVPKGEKPHKLVKSFTL